MTLLTEETKTDRRKAFYTWKLEDTTMHVTSRQRPISVSEKQHPGLQPEFEKEKEKETI